MFMVASSVVSTILILNYHHRSADTHEMSDWVNRTIQTKIPFYLTKKKTLTQKSNTETAKSTHAVSDSVHKIYTQNLLV